ncbi:17872_t:CDS:2 [Cetraspora pellucida]|uniref:17872_t:CDS:1 n=1 Tax=Cetraspora pellucida TaxID=1433469 RepID=A0A9N9FI62_9GLOM|nr:17872_t:CDS:2 [Cetraspora pellucida]
MDSTKLHDHYGFSHKQRQIHRNFVKNCKPATAHFNILQRVTAGLSALHQQLLVQQNKVLSPHVAVNAPVDGVRSNNSTYSINANHQGEGSFCQAVCAEDLYYLERRLVAIKIMAPKFNAIGIQECKTLRYLNKHDNNDNTHIVKLINTFMVGKHFCLVVDYYQGGTPKLPRIANEEYRLQVLRKLTCQLLTALMYIRHMGILHADLKLDNIICTTAATLELRVVDFGNAMSLDEIRNYFETFEVQTLAYRAPEVLMGLPFGFEIDMWSFGCIVCELWLGHPLFYSSSKQGMIREIVQLLGPFPDSIYANGKFFAKYNIKSDLISMNLNGNDKNMLV